MHIPMRVPALMFLFTLGLSACGGDDDDRMNPSATLTPEPEMAMFEVTLRNTTHNQPLSPPAVILHNGDYNAWDIGAMASNGLEVLAESGSPNDFITEATALDSEAGTEVLMPGQHVSFTVRAVASEQLMLTVATMLVNTNDAFTGLKAWPIGDLAIDASREYLAPVYDAGTEANSETAATVPGPAGGGEGFNSARNDVDFVARHPGVVTVDDGLMSSALDQSHRFDNGAVQVEVKRI